MRSAKVYNQVMEKSEPTQEVSDKTIRHFLAYLGAVAIGTSVIIVNLLKQ